MNIAKALSPFEVEKNGNDTVFTYKKSKLGLRTAVALLWPSFLLSAYLAYRKTSSDGLHTLSEKAESIIFYTVLFTILIAICSVIILNLFRLSGKFILNAQGIVLNGTPYPYSQIHSLYIKSPRGEISSRLSSTGAGFVVISNDRVQTIGLAAAGTIATAASTIANTATQLSNQSGKAISNSIRMKSYKICFQFGKSEKVLANRLSEKKAIALINEINKLF